MASVTLAVGSWVDVSALEGSGWVYCRDGVVNIYAGTQNSYDRAVGLGAAQAGRPIAVPPGTKFIRADTVSGTPACAYTTDGDQTETVVAAMVCGVAPAWGATLDRGANAGPGVFIMPPQATPDFEVQGSPDGASWFSNGQPEGAPQRANTAWGAFRYLRARAETAISLDVVGFGKAGGGGAPTGPAGGVLGGTYPNPDTLVANEALGGDDFALPIDVTNATAGIGAVQVGPFDPAAASTAGRIVYFKAEDGGLSDGVGNGGDGGTTGVTGGRGGNGVGATSPGNGGMLSLRGGPAGGGGVGNADGGDVEINGGARVGSGARGDVRIGDNDLTTGNVLIGPIGGTANVTAFGAYFQIASARYRRDGVVQLVPAAGTTLEPRPYGRLANTSGGAVTITSTPSIDEAGISDGTRVMLANVGAAADDIVLQDEATLPGSRLTLGAATRTLAQGGVIEFVYDTVLGWLETNFRG